MKILVAYFSETGNTKRVSEAIRESALAQGHDVTFLTVGEVPTDTLADYDAVFLGSTCHSSDIAAPVRALLEGIPQNLSTKLAGFVTHATVMPDDGEWQREMYEKWAGRCLSTFEAVSKEKGLTFLGFFHCQGAPSPPIEAFIHSTIFTDDAEWEEYVKAVRDHPTDEDVEAAKRFAEDTLAKC